MPEPGVVSPDIEIPAAGQDLYGKTVGDMVGDDVEVSESGAVTGTFHYVTGYTGFNESVPAEQEGYFFPFTLKETGTTMTFKKNGVVSKEFIPFEANNVFRVTGSDTFTVLVDDEEVITFSFSGATFEPKAEETAGVSTMSLNSVSEKIYTQEELQTMTVNDIKAIAGSRGYTITKVVKADVIAQFLEQQG